MIFYSIWKELEIFFVFVYELIKSLTSVNVLLWIFPLLRAQFIICSQKLLYLQIEDLLPPTARLYDRGDRFPFDFGQNGIPFGSKSKGKLLTRSYSIQYERKWKFSFLSVERLPDTKTVTDRLISVRETGVSRHQGGPIEGPPETPRTSQHYYI